jgi:hypothetical protein
VCDDEVYALASNELPRAAVVPRTVVDPLFLLATLGKKSRVRVHSYSPKKKTIEKITIKLLKKQSLVIVIVYKFSLTSGENMDLIRISAILKLATMVLFINLKSCEAVNDSESG